MNTTIHDDVTKKPEFRHGEAVCRRPGTGVGGVVDEGGCREVPEELHVSCHFSLLSSRRCSRKPSVRRMGEADTYRLSDTRRTSGQQTNRRSSAVAGIS